MKKIQFNINDKVLVQLTDHGRDVHKKDHQKLWEKTKHPNPPAYMPPNEDADGWSEWKMWTLMEAFGPHTHIGFDICFETTIILIISDEE